MNTILQSTIHHLEQDVAFISEKSYIKYIDECLHNIMPNIICKYKLVTSNKTFNKIILSKKTKAQIKLIHPEVLF